MLQRETFEELHRATESRIFRYIHARVSDYETVQDLTVETYVSVYRQWDIDKAKRTLLNAWVQQVAKKICDQWEQDNTPL